MAILRRPTREFSFSNFQRLQPTQPPPGHELDGMLRDLREAIVSTQEALAELRRDDGKLRNHLIDESAIAPTLTRELAEKLHAAVLPTLAAAQAVTHTNTNTIREAQAFASDAERAAITSAQFLAASQALVERLSPQVALANANAELASTEATDAENWANYAEAQASNAIKAKDESLQWAEYLAGPVVSGPDAPDFIESSKFPNGLFYQPIEGMGGMGGLWSSKWWAIYAQTLVGNIAFYYLGAWPQPPIPGAINPDTGALVPNPLPPGSFYFDTEKDELFVWNGENWQPFGLNVTPGYTARYVYVATANQTAFSGTDANGNAPEVEDEGHDVHLNGVRLVPIQDFTVDPATDTLTLVEPLAAGSVIQWDLLVPAHKVASTAIDLFKLDPLTPDGSAVSFPLTYNDPTAGPGTPADVGSDAQLMVSLDGIVQEAGVDYTAIGATLTMAVAPRADARLWARWLRPPLPPPVLP